MQNIQQEEEALYSEEQARYAERIRVAQVRANDLEKLICRIYEDHILNKIPDERYEALDSQYSQELKRMKEEITICEAALTEHAKKRGSAGKFADLFDNYQTFDNLTSAIVHQFVDKIVEQTAVQPIDAVIMKTIVDVIGFQPTASLFNGVTIFDTVKCNHNESFFDL